MVGKQTALAFCLLAYVAPATASSDSIESLLKSKIKHIIVLMEENRSFDHLFGFSDLAVDKLKGDEWNLLNTSNPAGPRITVSNTAVNVNPCDPDHSTPATLAKMGAGRTMGGFIDFENTRGNNGTKRFCDVMSGFKPANIPVISALASEFAIMDEFFCSHAGPTWPNRMYALSATSMGSTETSTWYRDEPGRMFPQRTIFDQVEDAGLEWRNYYNDTPWELFMEKLAHSPERQRPLTEFYADARDGKLPSYAWINPRCAMNATTGHGANDQHPDHDVALGEALYKDIYEALRSSPQWNETLFIVTYDEHGGFYDHVTPPKAPRPDDALSYPDAGYMFDTLGVRIPTLLISPWIKKGTVVGAPPKGQMPARDSKYDLTSIMATARKLLPGLAAAPPLTRRDAWAATFEHVIEELDEPRTDCPLHLPEAPAPAAAAATGAASAHLAEGEYLLNDLQLDIAGVHAHLANASHAAREGLLRMKQRDAGEWMQEHYAVHATAMRARALRLQLPSTNWTVTTGPTNSPGWLDTFRVQCGGTGTDVSSPCTSRFQTITTSKLQRQKRRHLAQAQSGAALDDGGVSYCLQWSNSTSSLRAAPCDHAGSDPLANRDSSQHWDIVTPDGTVHPYGRADLCLANAEYNHGGADEAQFLEFAARILPCDGSIRQHWAYGGNGGPLVYGSEAALGLV